MNPLALLKDPYLWYSKSRTGAVMRIAIMGNANKAILMGVMYAFI